MLLCPSPSTIVKGEALSINSCEREVVGLVSSKVSIDCQSRGLLVHNKL